MSGDNFLERWSRLKREAAQERKQETAPSEEAQDERTTDAQPATKTEGAEVPFDPASLPPIDSIDSLSDIRAFLAPGVPAALTRAALRRAWSADPAIRDFVGLSENSWDFTTPGSIPGFEGIGGSEELRRLVAHLTEGAPSATPHEAEGPVAESAKAPQITQIPQDSVAPHPAEDVDEQSLAAGDPVLLQHSADDAAPQYAAKVEGAEIRPRRGHGRALPE